MSDTNTDNQEKEFSGPIAYMARNPLAANLLMMLFIGGGIWTMINIQKESLVPND